MSFLKRAITKRYLFALVLIASLNTLSFGVLVYTIQLNNDHSELINKAGRQRMLSQKIALIVHEISALKEITYKEKLNTDLDKEIELFNQSHQTLRNLNHTIVHYGDTILDEQVAHFIQQTKLLAKGIKNSELLFDYSQFTKHVLLENLNSNVAELEELSDKFTTVELQIEVAIYILSLLLLILILYFVFQPMRDEILRREAKLNKSVKDLKLEGKYKSMFLANMSHELRTPLNGLLGVSTLLKSTKINTEQAEYITIIERSGNTLLTIINNILDLTKLEMNNAQVDKVIFSPAKTFDNLNQSFKYQASSKKIELYWENITLPEFLKGDEQKLKQIITNLISNSIKFTDKGFVKVISKYENNNLIILIVDTGIGIEADKLEYIFQPFKQADSSTTRLYGGTGLGLAICKQMADLMGGRLEVKSVYGEGTTFSLILPIPVSKVGPLKSSPLIDETLDSVHKIKGHVLVVEDNLINITVLSKLLDKSGLTVTQALDGQQAVDKVSNNHYDLILMDYHMPVLNGFEALIQMKKLEQLLPPVIIITADISEDSRIMADKLGASGFLEKPVKSDQLQNLLHKFLSS